MNIKDKTRQLTADIPALYLYLKNKHTALIPKILAIITVTYALSPVDLIPDFIPILGYLDDLIILPVLVAITIHFIPKETFAQFKKEAKEIWKDGQPKKWYYAIPIIIIWLFFLWFIIRLFL